MLNLSKLKNVVECYFFLKMLKMNLSRTPPLCRRAMAAAESPAADEPPAKRARRPRRKGGQYHRVGLREVD